MHSHFDDARLWVSEFASLPDILRHLSSVYLSSLSNSGRVNNNLTEYILDAFDHGQAYFTRDRTKIRTTVMLAHMDYNPRMSTARGGNPASQSHRGRQQEDDAFMTLVWFHSTCRRKSAELHFILQVDLLT